MHSKISAYAVGYEYDLIAFCTYLIIQLRELCLCLPRCFGFVVKTNDLIFRKNGLVYLSFIGAAVLAVNGYYCIFHTYNPNEIPQIFHVPFTFTIRISAVSVSPKLSYPARIE